MDPTRNQASKEGERNTFAMTVAAVIGQVGCLTLVILLGAIFLGIWLDNQLGTRPWFTLGLAIGSIPVTLLAMLWVVRTATARIQQNTKQNTYRETEEGKSGKNGGTTS